MRQLFLSVLTLVMFAGSHAAHSQTGSGRALSLAEAIQTALAKNYSVRIDSNSSLRSELELRRSKDALLPNLTAHAGYDYNYNLQSEQRRTTKFGGTNGIPLFTSVSPPGSSSANYGVSSGVNIYAGGGDAARIRSAKASLEAARGNFDWTRQQIAFNVTSAYLNALRTQQLVVSSNKTLEEAQAQLARSRALNAAGSIPIVQVYQQEALTAQDEVAVIQAQNDFENAKADLLFLLDIKPSDFASYSVTLGGIDTTVSSAEGTKLTDAEISNIIDHRPDIAAQQALIRSTEASIDAIRAQLMPRVDASASLGGSGFGNNLTAQQFSNSAGAGLTLSVPLFDRNQVRLQAEELEIDANTSRVRLNQQMQSIRSDLTKASNDLVSSARALEASQRSLRAAEESLRLAEERARIGAGISLDVLVAQSQLETARTNNVNARFNYLLAKKRIEFTKGLWNY